MRAAQPFLSLAVGSLPDDPTQLPRWLDEQLVGDRLGELVAELAIIHPQPTTPLTFQTVMGDALPETLRRGTIALPPERLQALLRVPELLLELQESVLIEGGPYWEQLPRPDSLREAVAQQRTTPAPFAEPVREKRFLRSATIAFVTAATVLVGVVLLDPFRARPSVAWAIPTGLPKNADAKGYFLALANGAAVETIPTEPSALAERIHEYRRGCTVLIRSEHRPLTDAQRDDLRERCRKWAGKYDAALVLLEASKPGDSTEPARAAVETTTRSLVAYLRDAATANP